MTEEPHSPGWYPDPWSAGQQRYWSGESWTSNVYAAEGTLTTLVASPPGWSSPPPPFSGASASRPAPRSRLSWRPRGRAFAAIAVIVGLVAGFGIAVGVTMAVDGHHSRPKTVVAPPDDSVPDTNPPDSVPPVDPAVSSDPAAAQLSSLVVRSADLAAGNGVVPLRGGNQLSVATLDICDGKYASEALRTARLQDAAVDAQGNGAISTEAVLYKSEAATAQAFAELRAAAAACPATPLAGAAGEPPVTTKFAAAPDGSWPKTAGVDRLAFDFTTTDASGQPQHQVAVYLRHGRALLGLYFYEPDSTQIGINGQTTVPSIVATFEGRMAALKA